MYPLDKRFDRILNLIHETDIKKLNDHLPKEYRTLKAIISNGLYVFKAKNDSDIIIDPGEVEFIGKILPVNFHDKLKLPFIFIRRMDLGKGVYELLGDKIEAFTILKILYGDVEFEKVSIPLRLYRPQIFKLKTILPTSIIIAFGHIEES
ncbi:MAG: DUF61 family protein [Candidatus Methanomethylicia archaeon]|nr:DUF61 family protein [Candidatus Methanomethylicia archaeon]MCX8169222.1 DUF61 family protein [Candidatus Methanomethylicia archaeon]MDW7988996.1 DUF61 family protein [Nitrososphaerota archaeon]